MADSGRGLLILKGGTAIAGARQNSMAIDNSPVDISDIAGGGSRKLADFAGNKKLDLSVSGVWDTKVLRDLAIGTASQLYTDITMTFADGGSLTGDFYLANYEETGVHDSEVTFTASFQSSGIWAYTTAI